MKNYTITTAQSENDLIQMLHLQQKNLAQNISAEQLQKEGFVTVQHTLEILKRMNEAEPQVIACSEGKVIGYALLMLKSFRKDIPILEPMFQKIEELSYQGKPLRDYRFVAMGQICIDEDFRGLGVFADLYKGIKQQTAGRFDLCITEVALRNPRSMRAHAKVGFENVAQYQDEIDYWALLLWDMR